MVLNGSLKQGSEQYSCASIPKVLSNPLMKAKKSPRKALPYRVLPTKADTNVRCPKKGTVPGKTSQAIRRGFFFDSESTFDRKSQPFLVDTHHNVRKKRGGALACEDSED